MRLAATNLSLPFNADESALMMLLASELRVKQEDIQSLRITRHSLDARDKADIRSIYSVSFELSTENAKRVALLGLKNVGKLPERSEREPEQGTVPQDAPAVVVGLGPAGLFAAHELAKRGYKVIVIERGKPIAERKADVETFFSQGLLNTNSNVMFGEGGAGTFSDGKLTTRIKLNSGRTAISPLKPSRISAPMCFRMLLPTCETLFRAWGLKYASTPA